MDKLVRIVSEALRIEPSAIPADLAIHQTETWNSLTHLELIVRIEEGFALQLTDDEIVTMTNLERIRAVLQRRGVSDR